MILALSILCAALAIAVMVLLLVVFTLLSALRGKFEGVSIPPRSNA